MSPYLWSGRYTWQCWACFAVKEDLPVYTVVADDGLCCTEQGLRSVSASYKHGQACSKLLVCWSRNEALQQLPLGFETIALLTRRRA